MRIRAIATLALSTLSVVALGVGCSSAKKDQDLATNIQARMFSDPRVKAANINVTVKNGEATLSGDAPDDGSRYQAYKIASDTPGVKHVVDQMTVLAAEASPVMAAPVTPAPATPGPAMPRAVLKPSHKTPRIHERSSHNMARSEPEQSLPPQPSSSPDASMAPAQPQPAATPPLPPPPPEPKHVQIPGGTAVRVQMIDGVDSSVNHAGDTFHASLASPIVMDNQTVVPAGTDMYLKLTEAKSAGHMTGQSELVLELSRMEFQGKSYSLESSDYQQTGASRGKRTAETVGGGAAIGALLGAVIGHGKGAAIGAATGAAAGGVTQGVTKGQQIKIPSETKLDFSLQQPVDVSYFPDKNAPSQP